MPDHAHTLSRSYEAFEEGDMVGVLAAYRDDIEWRGPDTPGLPDSGVRRGKDEVKAVFAMFPELAHSFKVIVAELLESDDTVVMLGHMEGRIKLNGRDFEVPLAQVWHMRDDKAARVQSFYDTAAIKDALNA